MQNASMWERPFLRYLSGPLSLIFLGLVLILASCDMLGTSEQLASETRQEIQHDGLASSYAALTPEFSESGAPFCIEGQQSSGALYEICLPPPDRFNGNMIAYARGFVFPQQEPTLPDDQLGGLSARDVITSQGFVYAATSFYTTGLIDPTKGVKDLRELTALYTRHFGRTYGQLDDVFLVGFSNGAMLSALAIEKHPGLYGGALASCGPIDSYRRQIDYFGDVFVLFDHFIGDVLLSLPVYPLDLPKACLEGSPEGFSQACIQGLLAGGADAGGLDAFLLGQVAATLEIVRTTDAAANVPAFASALRLTPEIRAGFRNEEEFVQTVAGALAYVWLTTNDAIEKLRGRPYDNTDRWYVVSPDIAALNQQLNQDVARYEADRRAIAQLEARYETKGHLRESLLTLHNAVDPIVPIWQAEGFEDKLRRGEDLFSLNPFSAPAATFGHCAFTSGELLGALGVLTGSVPMPLAAQ